MNKYLLIRRNEDDTISVATNYTAKHFEAIFSNGRYDANDSSAMATWNFLNEILQHFDNLLLSLNMIDVNIKQVVKCDPKELIVLFE